MTDQVPDRPPPRPPVWHTPPGPPPVAPSRPYRPRRWPPSPQALRTVAIVAVVAVLASVLLCAAFPPVGCPLLAVASAVYGAVLVYARRGRGRRTL